MEQELTKFTTSSRIGRGIRDLQQNIDALKQAVDRFELARCHHAMITSPEEYLESGIDIVLDGRLGTAGIVGAVSKVQQLTEDLRKLETYLIRQRVHNPSMIRRG